jgi:hypothetical protein
MTTPTTNYGWLKPQATEKANITVVNTMMDDVDADMKSVETTNSTKIYPMGQYRIKRKTTLNGDGNVDLLTSTLPDLWEEEWFAEGNAGAWTFEETGNLRFTSAGIYRITYNATFSTYHSGTTSGTLSLGLYTNPAGAHVVRTKTYFRSNTTDNVTIFPRTTATGSFYIWAGSGSDQCALNTDYALGAQHTTTAGVVNMIFSPNDLGVFRTQFTLECVRKLTS